MALSEAQQFELNRRICCFFFSGSHSRDEYIQVFNSLYPEKREYYAYSPLFLLRRDIYLFLKFDHFRDDLKVDHIAYFPALLLADIIIEGIVHNITAEKDNKKKTDEYFKVFFDTYFSFNENERLIVRQLRNALQHNFNQLIIRVKNKDRQKEYFETIKKHLENQKGIVIDKKLDYFKLGYQLSPEFTSVAEFGDYESREDHYLVGVKLNPKLFLDRLEIAINRLVDDIKNDDRLAVNFLKNLKVDNWMKVF